MANRIGPRAEGELPAFEASKLWTIAELAKHCGVSLTTIRRLVRNGHVETVFIGRSVRIRHRSFLEFIARRGTRELGD
jgi:excisionase family DNA binding protein